jgi:hypothetical protein
VYTCRWAQTSKRLIGRIRCCPEIKAKVRLDLVAHSAVEGGLVVSQDLPGRDLVAIAGHDQEIPGRVVVQPVVLFGHFGAARHVL